MLAFSHQKGFGLKNFRAGRLRFKGLVLRNLGSVAFRVYH